MKRGQQRCFLHPSVEGDPSEANTTPSDIHQDDELGRLLKLVKDYEQGDMPRLDWLDIVTFRQIEKVQAVSRTTRRYWFLILTEGVGNLMQREMENSNKLFLYVDLPRFDFPVVFAEQVSLALSRTVSIFPQKLNNFETSNHRKRPCHYLHGLSQMRHWQRRHRRRYRRIFFRQILIYGGYMTRSPSGSWQM